MPASGDMARTRSVIFMDGILGTKISPPRMVVRDESTKSTPSLSVIQNLVIRVSVIGRVLAPRASSPWKNGTTLPREPTTLP